MLLSNIFDPLMHIIWANILVQRSLGLSEDEIKEKQCFKAIYGLDAPCEGCTAVEALPGEVSPRRVNSLLLIVRPGYLEVGP